MDNLSDVLQHRVDAMSMRTDGSLLVAASSLTHRYWVGSLYYYKDAHQAVDRTSFTAMTKVESGVADIAHVMNSSRFVTGTDSGSVQLWEISEDSSTCRMACLAAPCEHDNFVTSISINADQSKALSASQDSRLKIWDLQDFVSVSTFKGHHDAVSMAACHLTEPSIFVSCSKDGKLLLWDTRKPRPASVIESDLLPACQATCLAWQPDSQYSLGVGADTGHVMLRDIRKAAQAPVVLKPHDRSVHRMAFASHRSDWVATASEDSTASVVQFSEDKSAAIVEQIQGHSDFVRDVAWHPLKHDLFTCSWDTRLKCSVIPSGPAQQQSPMATVAKDLQTKAELNSDGQVQTKTERMEILNNGTVEA